MAADVDRATCLGCHATGVDGAPVIPHEQDRTCGEEGPCWGGRTDCAGCHRIDPALGGATEKIEVSRWAGLLVEGGPKRVIVSLASDQLDLARMVGADE